MRGQIPVQEPEQVREAAPEPEHRVSSIRKKNKDLRVTLPSRKLLHVIRVNSRKLNLTVLKKP